MKTLSERIEIDIEKFGASVAKVSGLKLSGDEARIIDLAKMYASDSAAWMKRGDLDTAFSSIAYAHGLMDAVLKLKHLIE